MKSDSPKVAYLTSGAAGMFCGSCMHDNTLVRSLAKDGLDIQLIPTYTPIRTDEDDVSIDQVFFGGINVYLQQKIPIFRSLPSFLDRFLDRPWLIRKATARSIDIDSRVLGELTVSMLRGLKGNQRKEVRRLARWFQNHLQPDLIVLTNILIGGCIPHLKKELDVPILVTLQGDDIFLEDLPEPFKEQALNEIYKLVDQVDGFIAHSSYYADAMSAYLKIPRDRIHVTPLGIDTNDFQLTKEELESSQLDDIRSIGYLARLAPEKGLHVLVDSFIELAKRETCSDVRLLIAGWLGDHRKEYAEEQFSKLRSAGLEDRFEYVGAIDRDQKVEFLRQVNVLSVPTTYQEPKGLFALEALACAIPLVLPDHGAFPEIIRDTQGGVLVPPGDVKALADELEQMLAHQERRIELGQQGFAAVQDHRNASSMAKMTRELFGQFLGK